MQRYTARVIGLIFLGGSALFVATFFFIAVASLYERYIIALNITAFALYGFDKVQASRGADRIPNIVMHVAALAGGVLGAWLGMFTFRHKTRKLGYVLVLCAATALHLGIASLQYPQLRNLFIQLLSL